MLWILSILAFLVIFSVLILVHELGHFIAARKCGIKVEEFGFGLPPRLWKFKPKNSQTMFSLNAIPFGGFVRLYGEDTHNEKALQSKESFASKPAWMKLIVIVAGVVMNFVLAFVLLTIGLSVGMQPLIVSPEEAFQAVQDGTIKVEQGLVVKEEGPNKIGFLPGDKVNSVNGKPVLFGDEILQLKDKEEANFQVSRNGSVVQLHGFNDLKKPFASFYDPMILPKLVVAEVGEKNTLGLIAGRTIEKVNNRMAFSPADLEKIASEKQPKIEYSENVLFIRNGDANSNQAAGLLKGFPIVISTVLKDSTAEKAGLMAGDQVEEINQMPIKSVDDLSKALKQEKFPGQVVYKVNRAGTEIEYYVHKGDDGMIGVMMSVLKHSDILDATFYTKSVGYSILKVEDISYPVWQAPGQALQEMGKLSVLTAQMFGNVLSSIFTKFSVPEGVAGPVGIAQMTFVFVQEGVMSLIRFAALLSLSLAIINILPFPGLDGGRFFLIVVPLILRKKLNPKIEAGIHLFGFLVLMLLIFMVTFNDIARLFS